MPMRLILSGRRPSNSTYSTESGQILYKVNQPNKFNKVATIRKAVPNIDGTWPTFEGNFAFYAQVEFHKFKPSRLRYDGLDVSVKDYFRQGAWSLHGRGLIFKASDGKEYRWEMRTRGHIDMITNDENKTPVTRFRGKRPNLGPLMKGRPASLEVDPSCEPILDEIMMTFIYCYILKDSRSE